MDLRRGLALGLCLAGVGMATGCHRGAVRDKPAAEVIGPPLHRMTLYERLGGAEAIHDIVSSATDRLLADPALNFRREGTAREWPATPGARDRFREGLTDYLVSMTGGPAAWQGPTMLEIHHGMRISDREYDAFIADFVRAMRDRGVDPADGRELVRILEGLRGDIVEVR